MSMMSSSRIAAGILLLLVSIGLLGLAGKPVTPPPEPSEVDIEVFVREGCPHCETAKRYLDRLTKRQPHVTVSIRDVGRDDQAYRRFQQLAEHFDLGRVGVPAFYVRGEFIVGFQSEGTSGRLLEQLLERPPPETGVIDDGICPLDADEPCPPDTRTGEVERIRIPIPFIGDRTLADLGLPLFTIVIGLLDGFNPCAMWVLLFLLSLLANLRDRRKMFVLAGTFVLVSGVVYFIFMAAWLNLFLFMAYIRSIQLMMGGLAIAIGLVNVKEFWAFGKGVSLSIPESAKPGLYARVRRILAAERMRQAIGGIVVLAVLVNLIDFICTAGFPALYTHILSQYDLEIWQYYGYLVLYNLAYIADDAVMVTIGILTLSHRKLQEREGRWLKLIGGLVMLGLGLTLIFVPHWLF
jgi:glutaredoxin